MRPEIVLLFVQALCLVPLLSQNNKQEPLIRASVDVVNVWCTVRDRNGTYIIDLEKNDFEIYEDGVKQDIQFFNHETGAEAQPLSIVLLIDTSGSVKNKLRFEQKASSEFLNKTLRKNRDMAAVIQFDSEINLVQDFTYDYSLLENAILAIRAGGATRLYDATWLAIHELLRYEVGRRLVVILSDGADTQSITTHEETIQAAQEEDVLIYSIGVRGQGFDADFGKLKRFSKATGGLFFNSKADLDRLRDTFSRINQEIKNQYSIGYVSKNKERKGSFRQVNVRLKKRDLLVNCRKGYYAAGPH